MEIISSIPLYWWIVSSIGALTIVAVSIRAFETDRSRARRAERNKKKELRSLAERISSYGHGVHQQYPTGDVIVSERDLAEQLRKRPDAVVTALNLLLNGAESPTGSPERVLEIEHVIVKPKAVVILQRAGLAVAAG